MSLETEKNPTSPSESHAESAPALRPPLAETIEALALLLKLLQDYAPLWFTKQHEQQAVRALQENSGAVNASLQELFRLLESYAPAWYQPEHHQKALTALQSMDRP